ncbi:MAG TPA: metalloregulator ArsR/SmtB family transcription factor [Gemmatimonadales bacterium]
MDTATATQVLDSLASSLRLNIYRGLVRRGPDGMVAGEIAAALGLPANNVSFHLKDLTQANLVTVEQEGRFQRYRANIPLMLDLVAYLTEECCSGHPEQCTTYRQASRVSDGVLPALSRSLPPSPGGR